MNNFICNGHLGQDPQISTYGDGKKMAKFTLAVKRDGGKDETDWIPCTVFGKRAEVIEKYCSKGSYLLVCGALQTGTYEKDGQKRTSFGVIVNQFNFLPSGNGQQGQKGQEAPQAAVQPQQQNAGGSDFMEIPEGADDSGLPFNF